MTKGELINALVEYGEDRIEMERLGKEDLLFLLEDIENTSDLHPNESYEEFMEHEDY